MTCRANLCVKRCILNVLLLLLCVSSPAAAADGQTTVAGLPAQEALRLGEAMYQKGVLPSGKPVKAVVQGDIEVTGKMTTCASCHRRSGLGSLEGGVFTPPTNGPKLYASLHGPLDIPGSGMKRYTFKNPRPAYSDDSLANALLHGTGPSGKKLNEAMPRYLLDEDATQILTFYLKHLSAEFSPGVTGDEIRFATVVAGDARPGDRDALLLPLKAFLQEEWNERNAQLSSYNMSVAVKTLGRPSRKAVLDVWELKGPPATWGDQLEALYRQKPVFAILGGIAPGQWAPVHEFCEKNKIPCVLPVTDLPVVSGSDWYTLYFSKGLYQEGETAAKYLSRVIDLPPGKQVVQVFPDNDEGSALARGFTDTWKKLGNASLANRTVSAGEKTGPDFWKELSAAHPNAVMLVWLTPEALTGIESLAQSGNKPSTLFVSATMLAGALTALPDNVREFTFITYPTRLPGDEEYSSSVVTSWLKMKKIPVTNMTVATKAYFLTRLLAAALADMGDDYYRDFFLDILDDSVDQAKASVTYPMLSFGPGQRYAVKGCYVVTLAKGKNPKVVRQSDWVIY
jgi:ABC-type branched-subunit amino acid transport system substrate-binding protein/cytochrome c553